MRIATNRELQREVLEALHEVFPEPMDGQRMFRDEPRENLAAVLAYLEQHELVTVQWARPIGSPATPTLTRITAKGIDFIADDGGLGAILGVVTVKLHDETLRELLKEAVGQSDERPGMKARLIEQIEALPAEGLKEVTTAVARRGLAATPAAIAALRSYFEIRSKDRHDDPARTHSKGYPSHASGTSRTTVS